MSVTSNFSSDKCPLTDGFSRQSLMGKLSTCYKKRLIRRVQILLSLVTLAKP